MKYVYIILSIIIITLRLRVNKLTEQSFHKIYRVIIYTIRLIYTIQIIKSICLYDYNYIMNKVIIPVFLFPTKAQITQLFILYIINY